MAHKKNRNKFPETKLKIRFEQDGYGAEFRSVKDFSSIKDEDILSVFQEAKHCFQLREAKKGHYKVLLKN